MGRIKLKYGGKVQKNKQTKIIMASFKKIKKTLKEYLWISIGVLLIAISINIFLLPNKIAPGGVSGIATVIYYLSNGKISVGLIMLMANIPLFLLGIKFVGKKFIIRTLYSVIFLSIVIDTIAFVSQFITSNYIISLENTYYQNDILLYSIFGGLIMGLGLGIVFRLNASTGGTDMAARIFNKIFPNYTVALLILVIDICVIIFASISFRSIHLGLYAIITVFIMSKVIDAVLEGMNFSKAVFIVSDKTDEISTAVMKEIDRGITALKAKGMYTGTDKNVLLCVLSRGQIPVLKSIAKSIDERAFIILTDAREVLGEGFKKE